MRGISGSGKSTWIQKNHPHAVIASADDFFRLPDGTYDFSNHAERIRDAHKACYATFMQAMIKKEPLIIIDNTNIHAWEISPYVVAAEYAGYHAEIITIECDPETAIARKDVNTPEKVRRSAQRLVTEERHFPALLKNIHHKITPFY